MTTTLNITNLVGKIVIVSDDNKDIEQKITNVITDALLKATSSSTEQPSNKTDTSLLIKTMHTIISVAQEVINEASKTEVNDTVICDLAIERMDELTEDVEMAVFGNSAMFRKMNPARFVK